MLWRFTASILSDAIAPPLSPAVKIGVAAGIDLRRRHPARRAVLPGVVTVIPAPAKGHFAVVTTAA